MRILFGKRTRRLADGSIGGAALSCAGPPGAVSTSARPKSSDHNSAEGRRDYFRVPARPTPCPRSRWIVPLSRTRRSKRLPTTTDTPGDIIAVVITAMDMATDAHIMAMATTDPTTVVMDMGVAGATERQEHRSSHSAAGSAPRNPARVLRAWPGFFDVCKVEVASRRT